MNRKNIHRSFLYLGLGLLIASVGLFLIYQFFFNSVSKNKRVPSKEIVHHTQQIKNLGASNAYAEFKKQNRILKSSSQHNAVHLFGEALYSAMGLSGITICDNEFNYGCYHSVIGNTLSQEGLQKIPEINDYCLQTDNFLKCQHGIGHGIVAFLGYDLDNLKQSLEICDGLKKRDHIGGCFTGVFMEYNFQTMLAADAQIRSFIPSSPLYPCSNLSENFQQPCLYEQTSWWLAVLPDDFQDKISKIDSYCSMFSGDPQEACYVGLGVHLPDRLNWDNNSALASCQKLKMKDSQTLCIYGIASEFYSKPEFSERAKQLCNILSQEDAARCRKRAGINN